MAGEEVRTIVILQNKAYALKNIFERIVYVASSIAANDIQTFFEPA